MAGLEPQEENDPLRVLWYKPMACLGVIRPHRDEAWMVVKMIWPEICAPTVSAKKVDQRLVDQASKIHERWRTLPTLLTLMMSLQKWRFGRLKIPLSSAAETQQVLSCLVRACWKIW